MRNASLLVYHDRMLFVEFLRQPPLEKAPGPSSSSTTSQESMDRGETSEASSGDLDGGLGTAELGEKLSSVQEAFTRFDAVKVSDKRQIRAQACPRGECCLALRVVGAARW